MIEQRKVPRRRLSIYPEIVDRSSGMVMGKLADLTPSGVMAMCPHAVAPGKSVAARIILPQRISGKEALDFNARSVWCNRSDSNPDQYNAGFEFVKISEPDVRIISRLIFDFGLPV